MKVWTAQYRYAGLDRLDITVKTGEVTFQPNWDIVLGLKNHRIDQEQYTWQYKNLMDKSRKTFPDRWKEILARDEVTLVCFCPAGAFCHRVLLAKMLEEMGAQYMGERSLT